MINISIQVLTLFSALLVNFLIPLLFGFEEYGLFIKANILVFLFQKILDLVSEPLISTVNKEQILPIFIGIATFFVGIFLSLNVFFSAGSIILLSTMYWSNCVLLVMYAQLFRKMILFYLLLFNIIFLVLLCLLRLHILNITITNVLCFTNAIPATLCLFLLLVNRKLEISVKGLYANLQRVLKLIPGLCSLTLVTNFFTNILPFYLSFVISPQMLGLFKTQISIVQSVAAIFPINTKVISTKFMESTNKCQLVEQWIRLSMNYFYLISLLGMGALQLFGKEMDFSRIFLLLPILHITYIMERFLLAMQMRKQLILINILVSVVLCCFVLFVETIPQIILLYGAGIALYSLLMLMRINTINTRFKSTIISIVCLTPVLLSLTISSEFISVPGLIFCASIVFLSIPINKQSLHILRE